MRLSIWSLAPKPAADLIELSQHAEQTGWDGVWVSDHFMPHAPDLTRPRLESWALVSALAVAVPRLRIGVLVSGNTYRHPAVLAKAAVTADHLSGGRVVLGLGAGWQRNEHEAFGIDFFSTRERLARLEESCALIKSLITNEYTTFNGQHYHLHEAPFYPKPMGDLPLLVGGAGERVTLRIAAKHADEWNTWGVPEIIRRKCLILGQHCEALGRDPAEIARSAQALILMGKDSATLRELRSQVRRPERTLVGSPHEISDQLGEYADAGVDEFVVPDLTFGSAERRKDLMDEFIQTVAAPFQTGGLR